jgi:hypothetical protein
MSLNILYEVDHQGYTFRSGYLYKFRYQNWENDPEPLVFFLYGIKGTHPNTGHKWNLIQCLNLNYVERPIRAHFVELWLKYLQSTKQVKLTWDLVKRRYPLITQYCRRYLLDPLNLINRIEYIRPDYARKEVIRSLAKDFSVVAKRMRAIRTRNRRRGY